MFVSVPAAALFGVDAYRVDVEVDVNNGLPFYQVVGLADTAVKEAQGRIRAALRNAGLDIPNRRVTVNLAPADRRKDGSSFDLPIALAVVIAAELAPRDALDGLLVLGELGLDGVIRPVRGVLAAASLARDLGLRGVLVPRANGAEAAAVSGMEIHVADHLGDVLRALRGEAAMPRHEASGRRTAPPADVGDFADVRGQTIARRAVEIAVAGGHNVLLYGAPGIGKTMIARRLPTILPAMSEEESLEVTRIYSAAGLSPPEGLVTRRPFRAPHHSTSPTALIGGGAVPRPGEVSLAHRGVLFLDELPEFSRGAVEMLRQPLEERVVRIGRVRGCARMPASFFLVVSANPCPCGWHGSLDRSCTCPLGVIERYRGRLSGPLLDRIDLQVRVRSVRLEEMRDDRPAEASAVIRERVEAARARQLARLGPWKIRLNAELTASAQRATCALDAEGERLLAQLFSRRVGMTARGLDRTVRVARTICDLDGRDRIDADAIREAASYRALDLDPLRDPREMLGMAVPAAGKVAPSGRPDLGGGAQLALGAIGK